MLTFLIFLFPTIYGKEFLDYIDPEVIRENLRHFTTEPHVAGTPANLRLADKIADKWREYGLEDVSFKTYEVLLSYPNYSNPNIVRITGEKGQKVFQSTGKSPVIIPEEQGAPGAGIQWLAYAGNGKAKGAPVYCNYGTETDFERLRGLGVNLRGKIAVIRYGKIFRANKIKFAQLAGAVGVILYSDPAEAAQAGIKPENVYPNKDYMPAHGVQRGTLKLGDGDPLTPLYPSRKDLYFKTTIEQLKASNQLPSIPVLPLSYSDAFEIFSRLKGRVAPKEWQGGLKVDYRVGPGLNNDDELEIEVHSTLEKKEIRNVIGYIRGETEPDRYVMLGNHFDAWVYGSIDPNSGTAILSGIAKGLAQAKKDGVFKPERTILFCNWDAEEYGLVGSNEFVEEYANILRDRAVVMLNVDLICGNGTMSVDAVPSIYEAVVAAAKKIPNPVKSELAKGRPTVYDTWVYKEPGSFEDYPDFPKIDVPSGGSDHETFIAFLGIPAADIKYKRLKEDGSVDSTYALYHSLYETPFTNEHLFDIDNFSVHAATGKYWMQLARDFAEPSIIPINASLFAHRFLDTYVRDLKAEIDSLSKRIPQIAPVISQNSKLIRNSQEFVRLADTFQSTVRKEKEKNNGWTLTSRSINDRLMAIERCFVGPKGIPGSPAKRNVLFSTSSLNSYEGKTMPGVYDQLDALVAAKTDDQRSKVIEELLEQISHVQHAIQCATSTLSDYI